MDGGSKLRATLAARVRDARERLHLERGGAPARAVLKLDRLSVRGRIVHGWGWAVHPTRRIESLTLACRVAGGQLGLFAEYGFARTDLAPEHADAPNGTAAGFVVYGIVEQPIAPGDPLRFVVEFDDGEREEVVVAANVTFLDGEVEAKRAGVAKLRRFGKQGTALLRSLAPWRDDAAESPEAIARGLRGGAPVILMLDHDLGGGANVFRRKYVEKRLADGALVVLLRWSIASLSWAVDVHADGASTSPRTLRFFDVDALGRWLGALDVGEVVLNNVVSYPTPIAILAIVSGIVARRSASLTVFVHDFEAVCPSWTLLDDRGEFCGVPDDRARCEACFAATRVPFKSVLDVSSVAEWREGWARVLRAATEIRCFSQSSKTLLLRAHPELEERAVTVVPHQLEHVRNRPAKFDLHAPIRIGVVGEIARHKGSEVVRELAAVAARRGLDVRVTVIGALAADVRCEDVAVTGRYEQSELPDLLERHGINVCLFPSIWPETFSYVCEELMHMGVPLVCFDLGAPAERVRGYARGCVVPRSQAPELLDRILEFTTELGSRERTRATP